MFLAGVVQCGLSGQTCHVSSLKQHGPFALRSHYHCESTTYLVLEGRCSDFFPILKSDIANKITLILKGSDRKECVESYLDVNIKKTMR